MHNLSSQRRIRKIEMLEPRVMLASDVVINEFMAANSGTLRDFEGDSRDWIELHNTSDNPVDLNDWSLSDESENVRKWEFPRTVIEPHDYLVIFASGKDVQVGDELHTNFRLRAAGEFLSLAKPDGTVASSFEPTFPAQSTNISYGLPFDDNQRTPTFLVDPTPGQPNSPGRLAEQVTASHTAPTFVDPFDLSLSGTSADQRIVYTLDGSIPDSSSTPYDAPIRIDRPRQVRARVVESDSIGPVRTWSYSQITQEVSEFTSGLPILLIDNFGDGPIPNKGFPNQTGADTFQLPRQAAAVTLFEPGEDGRSNLKENANLRERIGIRVRGAFSSTFDEPGYSLEFWDESDSDKDVAPLDFGAHSDWVLYAPNPTKDITLIDNTLLFSISDEMGHWAPSFQYVEAFINTGTRVSMNDHVGLYVIEDKVTRGQGRIEFEKMSPDATEGGWLLTVNRMDAVPENDPNGQPQHFHTAGPNGVLQTAPNRSGRGDDIPRQYNAFINFEDPNGYKMNLDQRESIESWFKNMEDVLYDRTGTNWNDPVDGYTRYIDTESFIDYFILNNISKNGDGFLLSMWLYNPDPHNAGKLTMGPIWDADLGSFQGDAGSRIREEIDRLWYGRMFEDPEFQQQYIDRWFELRETTLSRENVERIIDDLQTHITQDAVVRDGVTDWPNRIADLKKWLGRRFPRIDRLYTDVPELAASQDAIQISGEGQIYYTLDGSDPRQTGGDPTPQAVLLDGTTVPLPADFSGLVTTRAVLGGSWSAPTTLPIYAEGDTNLDGQLDTADIDALWAAVRANEYQPMFDLNSDDVVNEVDVEYLIANVLDTRSGDANLDGRVNFTDFLILSSNFGKEQLWSEGNFDGNTRIDFADFLLLSAQFGFRRDMN